ncbi:hypothetical protein HDU97_009743 [Phlyctochytrium planicorne]|nr:hypothetical protein HDU97_009743 [Phlyctochytrium planicorne]
MQAAQEREEVVLATTTHSAVVEDYLGNDRLLAEALSVLCQGLRGLLQRPPSVANVDDLAPSDVGAAGIKASMVTAATAIRKGQEGLMSIEDDVIMRQRIENVRSKRPQNISELSPEHKQLWQEIDQLVGLVEELLEPPGQDAIPPSYNEVAKGRTPSPLPDANSLHDVLNAIDRIFLAAPRMVNQTAIITDRQQQRLATASLVALIERLLSGRESFENQRAEASLPSRHALLNDLIDKIVAAGERSYVNQRAEATYHHDLVDLVRLVRSIENQRKRYDNQDSETRDMILKRDLALLAQDVIALEKPWMQDQRFVMSDTKQRDMFMKKLVGSICKGEDRRLSNQDASTIQERKEADISELVMRLSVGRMEDQRAAPIR